MFKRADCNRFSEVYRYLEPTRNKDINKLKIHSLNFEHELAKFIVCYNLKINGSEFVTEGIFKNKRS
jgi:hypothetical protein